MKSIVSYNVNGIRAAVKKGLLDWIKEGDYDIVCIQETKCQKEQAPLVLIEELGYEHYWHCAQKKGYSGVVTFTKQKPDLVKAGMGIEKYDNEGRVLRTDFGDWTLLNCYFPSGSSGSERQDFKYEFLADFEQYIQVLKEEREKIIVVGDYNIAHHEIDIHNPKSNKKSSGFLPEEREWMTKWLESGFVDTYRSLHPEEQTFSWWSTRFKCREQNKGWRIDYQCISESMKAALVGARQANEAVHSDHCPVVVQLDI